jgi:hypothetical protein
VREQTYPGGSSEATFTPPSGGSGITLTAAPPDTNQPETEIPNRYCTATKIHGLSAFRCFDTIAFSRSTEIFGPRAIYTIAMAGRRADYQTYERLVNSFRLISG